MAWWNAKSFEQNWFTVIKYKKMIVGYPDREPTTLTGREIEVSWAMEQTDQTTTDLTLS